MKGLLFTYLLTYGGGLVSLFRPFYGFLIYVCFGILKPEALWHWSVPEGNYSRIVAVALVAGWVINGFGDLRLGRGRLIVLSMVGFLLVIVVGAMGCSFPDLGWQPVEPMAKTFLPIVIGATLIDSLAKLKALVWVIVLCQGYLAFEFNLNYYGNPYFSPREFYHGGLDNNGIAITMVTSLGLAFFLGRHAERRWQQLLALTSAALMAHVVLFSNSRGGMLSLLVTGGACFVLIPRRRRDYLLFFVALALVFRLAGEGVQQRFMTIFAEKGATEEADEGGKRLQHWAACWDSMQKRPLGVGPAHWPVTAPEYGLPKMAGHSTWLQIGAELGWPGLLFLAGIYGICLVRLWPLAKERATVPDPWFHDAARMVIASLVGFLASAQFVTVDGVELPYYIVLVGASTLKVLPMTPASVADPSPLSPVLDPA